MEHGDPVRHRQRFVLVVRDVDHRDAQPLVQPAHLELHLLAELLVERAERLVHQHQLRLEHERASDGDALLLPARQLRRLARAESRELHHVERALDTLVDLRARRCRAPTAESRCSRATVMCGNSA